MESNYPGYAVGGARELVTLAMLKHIQDGTVLFPAEPYLAVRTPNTFGRCKEEYQTGGWQGYRVALGANASSVSGRLVVSDGARGGSALFLGLFGLVVVS